MAEDQGANAVKEPLITLVESCAVNVKEPEILGEVELITMVP